MSEQKKHVVVVGAGFAGTNVTRKLAKNKNIQITVIDKKNHHLFQPLLYQVAMAALSPADIAYPIRSLFSGYNNVEVVLGEVSDFDAENKLVKGGFGEFHYDYLVLACGAGHCYFGNNQWEEFAPGLKSIEEACDIRSQVLTAFELAEREKDPDRQRELLTFVVIGAGPTGVELAGALGEITRYTLSKDFRHIDVRSTRIILIEGGPRILPTFSPNLSHKARRSLEKLGVTLWTSSRVSNIDAEGVTVGNERIRAATVIWAAGVQPSPIGEKVPAEKNRGRVVIEPDLSIKNHPEFFVLGDQSYFAYNSKGEPSSALPGVAPVAMQQGTHCAKNILADLEGKERKVFRYVDKGSMATIGRARAIVEVAGMKFSGIFAWLTWLFIHILYLIGFRNKILVLMQWAWCYIGWQRGARLITDVKLAFHQKKKKNHPNEPPASS